MTNINDGGPAFPCPMSEQTHSNQDCAPFQGGASLRDYFAAKAMQGVLSNSNIHQASFDVLAKIAYKTADAMLKARSEGGDV